MWLLTPIGFYSIVEKPYNKPKGTLTVRARAKEDLQALGDRYLTRMSAIADDPNANYRFRVTAKKEDVVSAIAAITRDIDHSNFKDEVGRRQGFEREMLYSQVLSTLRHIQHDAGDYDEPIKYP